jgi:hypothetical protein
MKRNKGFIHVSIYNGPINGSPSLLLRPYNLELARNVCEEVSVGLGDEFALVGLLYKVLMASSLLLNWIRWPFIKSAEDCHPISWFSHLWPLGSTSQSINQCEAVQLPDCVAVFVGR